MCVNCRARDVVDCLGDLHTSMLVCRHAILSKPWRTGVQVSAEGTSTTHKDVTSTMSSTSRSRRQPDGPTTYSKTHETTRDNKRLVGMINCTLPRIHAMLRAGSYRAPKLGHVQVDIVEERPTDTRNDAKDNEQQTILG